MNIPHESNESQIQQTSELEHLYILKGEGGAAQYRGMLDSLSNLSR